MMDGSMMTHRVLQVGRLLPELEKQLAEIYDLYILADHDSIEKFLMQYGNDFVGLVTSAGGEGVPSTLMASLPALKVISVFGVGLEKIDLAQARERGIFVGYTPNVLNDCVADTAFALMLTVARRVCEADRFVRDGRWPVEGVFGLGRKVSGARLGIVGLGRIGQTIARRAIGFDMDVRYHCRRPVTDVAYSYESSILNLATWADFLVIVTTGGAETKHLINAETLSALGSRGFLINVSRGSVVDELALVQALKSHVIAGAGLDVFKNEPFVSPELFSLDNVVLLPHIASATYETRALMAKRVLDNLASFFVYGSLISSAI